MICEDIPVHFQLYKRFNKYMYNNTRNSNPPIRQCLALIVKGSTSNLSKNINVISQDLKCTRETILSSTSIFKQSLMNCESLMYTEQDKATVGNIKDLMYLRDVKHTRFTETELNFMINHLCTY